MNERDASMDDILASIRAAVVEGPLAAVPGIDDAGASRADQPTADFLAESTAETLGFAPGATVASPPTELAGMTVEALVRSTLEPILKAWLDAHLPEIVDRAAQAEIARLIGRGG